MYQQQQQYQQVQDTNPPCRQLMAQPPHFGPQWQAPFPGNLGGLPPQVLGDLPVIANAVGNTVGQWAQQNHAYTYYFNVVAMNGFNNKAFLDLVEFAGRLYWLLLQERVVGSPQEGLQRAVEDSVRMLASVTVLQNPALQQHLSPQIWNGCIEFAGRMQKVIAQFNNPQSVQGYAGQSAGYGAAGVGYAPAGAGYGRPVGVVVEPFQPVNVPQQQQYQQTDSGAVYVPHNRSRRTVAVVEQAQAEPGAHYLPIPGMKNEEPVRQKAAPPAPAPEPAARVTHFSPTGGMNVSDINYRVMGTDKPANLEWTPFMEQLYLPAYDANYQEVVFENTRIANSHTFRTIAFVQPLENPEMNRADHVITTAQALYRGMNKTAEPRTQQVSTDLDLAAKAVAALATREDEETTETYRSMNLLESDVTYSGEDSLISFVTTARLRRMSVQEPGQRKAFMIQGSIVTNFVVDQDLAMPLFTVLAELKTFDEAVDALRAFTERNQTEAATALVWRIDRYLRRELLHVIRKRMGCTMLTFDSFIDDQADVFKVLEMDWGPLYRKALAKYQGDFLKAVFGKDNVKFADDNVPLVSSEPMSTVTLLDIDYDEFGVRIADAASHEVFPSNFPGLYEFITAVVTNHPEALHHYIVTEDDHVYEVHRSIVGDKVFLISNGPELV